MTRRYHWLGCCIVSLIFANLSCHQIASFSSRDDGLDEDASAGASSDDGASSDEQDSDQTWLTPELDCEVQNQIYWMAQKNFEVVLAEGVETRFTALPHSYLRFIGEAHDGERLKIKLFYDVFVDFSETTGLGDAIKIDLQDALEEGSVSDFRCALELPPNAETTFLDQTNSEIRGEINIRPLSGRPGSYVELCIVVQPHHMSMAPYLLLHSSPIYMYPDLPCQAGLDQTCNQSPEVSALRGTCDDDGFCTCEKTATKTPSGKCALQTD